MYFFKSVGEYMNEAKKLYILLDYDGRFYCEWDKKEFSLYKFVDCLENNGFNIELLRFCDIDFRKVAFKDTFIIYSSSEVKYYKDYIDDILLAIHYMGGILIPNYYLFKAHHNKSFQEIYKILLNFGNLYGKPFGTLKEFSEKINNFEFPIVLKPPDEFGSKDVLVAYNYSDALRKAKKLSSSFESFIKRKFFLLRAVIAAKFKIRDKERTYRIYAKKFVVQKFLSNLYDDWKLLIFNKRYYVLNRKVRKNDFRASGSGKFSFIDPPEGLLDYAETIFRKLNSPYLALDIVLNDNKYYLLEFQALYFGLFTILNSKFYYEKTNNYWKKQPKTLSVEEELADSISNFIKVNYLEF